MSTTRWQVRPGGVTALQARFGFGLAALFLLFGLVLAAAVWGDVPGSETGLQLALGAFLLVWVAGCVAIMASMARLLSASRGSQPGSLLELQGGAPDGAPGEASPRADLDTRLRKLTALRRDGLLSEAEYQAQRQRALQDGW
jgi:hypothetical protein